jgi:large subunit ribosomal protein L10
LRKAQKVELGKTYREKTAVSAAMIFTEYRGLTVREISELRNKLRKESVTFRVVKNRVLMKAVEGTGIQTVRIYLKGPTAVAFHAEDAVVPAKILIEFAKEHANLKIKAAVVEGLVMNAEAVKVLATLPGKKELRSMVAGQVNSLLGTISFSIDALLSEIVGLVEAREKAIGVEAAA